MRAHDDVTFEALQPRFEKLENRLYAAKKSFKWFVYLYLSHHLTNKPADFHLQSYARAREPRLLEVWPRGFGKSRTWSIFYPLWVLLNNPYDLDLRWKKEELFCISNTGDLAEKWIRWHKRELMENARILHDYKTTQGGVWRVDEIEVVVRGHLHGRIVAKGSGAQIRGEHPTEVIIDDLENREEASSEGPREKMKEYFYQDLWGTFRHNPNKPDYTRCKVVGTFVHPLALLPELYNQDWWTAKSRYAVYKEDGTPLWPDYMDDEALRKLRSETPETAWASEYLNAPIVSENPTFMREWFQSYEPGMIRLSNGKKIETRDMHIVTAIDPAISQKDGADYTAIATFGAIWDEKEPWIGCLDARRGHWTISRQINELLASYEKFNCHAQLIETVAYQKALYYEYKDRLDREHLNIRVIEVVPDRDKGRRANAITPLFQKGWVHFDHRDKMQKILMDELALFDYAKRKHGRDDFVDATSMCLNYIENYFRRCRSADNGKITKLHLAWTPDNPVYGGAVANA